MEEQLRRYELYVIFQPDLEDEQLEARIDRLNGYLTSNNGEIVEVARKGKRRLVYPINRYNQGIDVVYQAYLPSRSLGTLERQLNLFDDIIRYLLVRLDEQGAPAPAAEETTAETAASPAADSETPAGEETETEEAAEAEQAAEATETVEDSAVATADEGEAAEEEEPATTEEEPATAEEEPATAEAEATEPAGVAESAEEEE